MTVAELHKELSLLIEQGHGDTRVIANINFKSPWELKKGENGKRLINLCYQIGLMRKIIRKDGQYSDGSECAVYICKSCFSRNNNEKIMQAIWKGHEYAKKARKQRGEE